MACTAGEPPGHSAPPLRSETPSPATKGLRGDTTLEAHPSHAARPQSCAGQAAASGLGDPGTAERPASRGLWLQHVGGGASCADRAVAPQGPLSGTARPDMAQGGAGEVLTLAPQRHLSPWAAPSAQVTAMLGAGGGQRLPVHRGGVNAPSFPPSPSWHLLCTCSLTPATLLPLPVLHILPISLHEPPPG